MSFWDLLVLSIIQGVAEFLPISSSGHLVLIGHWLGVEQAKGTLNIMLHAGTLLSIVVFYYSKILKLLSADRRVVILLLVGTIPAGLAGVLIKRYIPAITENAWLAASMLIVTGLILWGSRFLPKTNQLKYPQATWRIAWGVGLAQAFAILPGISRSGSTIFAGQFLGLNRESAGTFSFLLAIPIIAGASLYEMISLARSSTPSHVSPILLGMGVLISFVVGYFSLKWLVLFIQQGRFHLFAWWCIPFGCLSLILLATVG